MQEDSKTALYDLQNVLDGLKGALLRYRPADPHEFCIGFLRFAQQKRRESTEVFDSLVLIDEFAKGPGSYAAFSGRAAGSNAAGSYHDIAPGKKRPRSEDHPDYYMDSRTPPYNGCITQEIGGAILPETTDGDQRLPTRIHRPHLVGLRQGRRQSVSAESIRPTGEPNIPRTIIPKTPQVKMQIEQATQQNLLFKNLEPEMKEQIWDSMFEKPVRAGEIVIKQNDNGEEFYVVAHGLFDIFVGDKWVLQVGDGGTFGELALLYNTPRAATVKAITDGLLWAVDRVTFNRTITNITYRKRKTYETLLSSVNILESLQPSEISQLADAMQPLEKEHDDIVISQGDNDKQYFYIIEQGYVDVSKVVDNQEIHLLRLGPNQYFGELALINDEPRKATVTAAGPVRLAALKRDAFVRLLPQSVMEHMRRHAANYDQRLSPTSPVPPLSETLDDTDVMAVDDSAVVKFNGPGGVNVL